MRRNNWGWLLLLAGVLVWVVLFWVNRIWAQALFGVALTLVLPGYLLSHALLPGRALGITERATLTLGLSIAVVILTGLILNLTPVGLQFASWVFALALVCIGSFSTALIRGAWWRTDDATPRVHWRLTDALFLLAAFVVASIAVTMAVAPAPADSVTGYTNLWIAPADSTNPTLIRVGIYNQETTPMDYAIEIKADDRIVSQLASIALAPGEQWEGALNLPVNHASSTHIEADLYRLDQPGRLYRQVFLNRNK